MSSSNSSRLLVRHALAAERDLLREIRLASLAADPDAFASTYEGDAAKPPAWWEWWAGQSEAGATQRTFVLVTDEDRWVGLALVRLDDDKAGSAILNAMWVAPEMRGRRGASLLCDACASWAAERGCDELTLDVVVDNHVARHAYEASGFTVRGETTWSRDGRTLDEFVMARSLSSAQPPSAEAT